MNCLKRIGLLSFFGILIPNCCLSQINIQNNFNSDISVGFSGIPVYSSQLNYETSSRSNQNLFNPSIQAFKYDVNRFAFNQTTGNINQSLLYETDKNVLSEFNFANINAQGFTNKYNHRDIYNPYGSDIRNGLFFSGANYIIYKIFEK